MWWTLARLPLCEGLQQDSLCVMDFSKSPFVQWICIFDEVGFGVGIPWGQRPSGIPTPKPPSEITWIHHMSGVLHLFHDVQHIWPEKMQENNETKCKTLMQVSGLSWGCEHSSWPIWNWLIRERLAAPWLVIRLSSGASVTICRG